MNTVTTKLITRLFPLALTTLCACGDFGYVRIILYTQESSDPINEDSEYEPLVRDAVGVLGYDVIYTTRKRGAVALELIEADNLTFIGRRLVDEGCYRAGWAVPHSEQNVAHELGHMLGLGHFNADGNLMRQGGDDDDTDLFRSQIRTLDSNVRELGGC